MYYYNQHLTDIIYSLLNINGKKNGQNHYLTKLLGGLLSLSDSSKCFPLFSYYQYSQKPFYRCQKLGMKAYEISSQNQPIYRQNSRLVRTRSILVRTRMCYFANKYFQHVSLTKQFSNTRRDVSSEVEHFLTRDSFERDSISFKRDYFSITKKSSSVDMWHSTQIKPDMFLVRTRIFSQSLRKSNTQLV